MPSKLISIVLLVAVLFLAQVNGAEVHVNIKSSSVGTPDVDDVVLITNEGDNCTAKELGLGKFYSLLTNTKLYDDINSGKYKAVKGKIQIKLPFSSKELEQIAEYCYDAKTIITKCESVCVNFEIYRLNSYGGDDAAIELAAIEFLQVKGLSLFSLDHLNLLRGKCKGIKVDLELLKDLKASDLETEKKRLLGAKKNTPLSKSSQKLTELTNAKKDSIEQKVTELTNARKESIEQYICEKSIEMDNQVRAAFKDSKGAKTKRSIATTVKKSHGK